MTAQTLIHRSVNLFASGMLMLGIAGCNGGAPGQQPDESTAPPPGSEAQATQDAQESASGDTPPRTRHVRQEEGQIVYWVLPGPRKLSESVFGTPDNPKMLAAPKIAAAEKAVEAGKMPPSVPGLLRELPLLVGIPEQARTMRDGQWVFAQPNPFGDQARIVDGHFEATFEDHVTADPPGPPGKTPDTATFEAQFTDPAGNGYRLVLDHIVKPPFPGYETQGGVMIDATHHGDSGTGSPLMPEVETLAALWGVGELYVNGELVQPAQVFHVMTTEVVRNTDYQLAHEEDLPLSPEQRHIRGQEHHTHLMVMPVTPVPGQGPSFEPVKTAFELPNGQMQPFMHIMFEQDSIESG